MTSVTGCIGATLSLRGPRGRTVHPRKREKGRAPLPFCASAGGTNEGGAGRYLPLRGFAWSRARVRSQVDKTPLRIESQALPTFSRVWPSMDVDPDTFQMTFGWVHNQPFGGFHVGHSRINPDKVGSYFRVCR